MKNNKQKILTLFLALVMVIGMIPIFSSVDVNAQDGSYIGEIWNTTRKQVINEVTNNSSRYIGRPYFGYPNPSAPQGTGNWPMNCVGLVANVIENSGGNIGLLGNPNASSLPSDFLQYLNANGVMTSEAPWNLFIWLAHLGIPWSYRGYLNGQLSVVADTNGNPYPNAIKPEILRYDTYQAMLADGKAKKGDIMIITPTDGPTEYYHGDIFSVVRDIHVGMFWGDTPSDPKVFHSSDSGVQIEHLSNFNKPPKGGTTNNWYLLQLEQDEGSLELKKVSNKPEISEGNNNYTLAGAEYGVYNSRSDANSDRNRVGLLTTIADGTSNTLEELKAGTFYIKELKAPKGFVLDPNIHAVEVKANQIATFRAEEIPKDDPIGIVLRKKDATTGKESPQGGALLEGAEFTVKFYGGNYADGVDPSTSGILPTKTWVIKTDNRGYARLDDSYKVSGDTLWYDDSGNATLPLGTVTIQETKAPEGYHIDDTVFVRKISESGAGGAITPYNEPIIPEQVQLGDFSLTKVITDGEQSEITKPEEGAVFIAIAKKYIEQYGSFEEAVKHLDTYGINEWSKLVTDASGNATSGKLAYGTYVVKQTEGTDEHQLLKDPFEHTVKSEGDTYHYVINNIPDKYMIKIYKKDSVTGAVITLTPARFKITDANGEQVTMKVGSKVYDTFMTSATDMGDIPAGTFYGAGEDEGTLVTPLKLPAGKYMVQELESPMGYLISPDPFEVILGREQVGDNDEYIEVEIDNTPQYGELTLHKKGEQFKAWEDVTVTYKVQEPGTTEQKEVTVPRANEALHLTRKTTEIVEYNELVITEPVIDPDTGEIIEEGFEEVVNKTREEEIVENETVYTDANGLFERVVEHGSYTVTDKNGNVLAELEVAEGATDTISVKLPDDTRTDEVYHEGAIADQDFTCKKATYETGYLPGAEFALVAKEDIKSFDGSTVFYKQDDKLLFAQKDIVADGETVYKKGEVITFPKLTDTEMQDKTLVDSVVKTENNELVISRIPLGLYDLVETKAPKGYIKDETVREYEFTPQEQTILVDLKETPMIENVRQKLNISLSKVLLETEYFDRNSFDYIVIGMFTNEEILGLPKDSMVAALVPDANGKMTVSDVPEGSYYFKELTTKDGYILDEGTYDVTVTSDEEATEDSTTVIEEPIENVPTTKDLRIIKKDKDTGKPLVGVEFYLYAINGDEKVQVLNKETGDYIFTTDKNGEIFIKDLPFGTYSLEEIKTIDGYIPNNESKEIAVAEDSLLEIVVENEATRIGINKIDAETGKPVIGATLRLLDQYGNLVYLDDDNYITTDKVNGRPAEWVTDGNLFYINGLTVGHQYRVVEVDAPVGYHDIEDIEFTVTENKGIQITNIPNRPYEPKIKTKAFNADTKGKILHAISKAKVCDVISYEDLIPGREHLAKAKLVLKSDPTVVIAEAELKFIPDTKDGEVEVCFGEIDLRDLAGKELVVFEKVFDLETMLEVASHEEPDDPEQTVKVEEPDLHTNANTKDGNVVAESKDLTIVDKVTYTDLIVGEEYTVKGILMDKSTGKALLVNGKEVRAETTFIAETADGQVEVTFNFDATGLGGKDIVVFEELYYKGELIAEHKDINDEEQTVKILKPVIPEKPVTNDNSTKPVTYLIGGGVSLLLGLGLLLALRKRKTDNITDDN